MSDVVSVALNLLPAGFVSGLGVAAGAARKFGKDVQSDFDAPKKNLGALGTAGLVAGGAVVAGFGLAVMATLDFDKALSELGATTGATGEEMDAAREKALQLGADTSFSASEAAQAMVELGKAGLTTDQILAGAADATVALAAAGGVALPAAAEIAASAMTQFGLAASDLPHVADLLAGAANASQASVEGLGTALGYVGPVAAAAGWSIDDTSAALALLAKNGLDASTSGTSLRFLLTHLEPTTAKARAEMEKLGIITADGANIFFDATGKAKPLAEIVDIMQDKFGGMSAQAKLAATNLLFGEQSMGAVNAMASMTDEQLKELQDTLANTSAAEVAAEKLDNLSGDLEALGGSIETALVTGGSKATSALRGIAQGATTVTNGLTAMPEQLQWVLIGLTGIAGSAAGIGGVSIKVAELSEKLEGTGRLGDFASRHLGAMTAATAGVTLAIAGFAYAQGVAAREQAANDATTKSLTDQLIAQAGAVDMVTQAWLRKQFSEGQRDNIGETLVDTNANLDILTRGIEDQGTALDAWRDHIFNTGEGWGYLEDKLRSAAGSGDAMSAELLRLVDSGQITGNQAVQLVRDFDFLNDRIDEASGKARVNAVMTSGMAAAVGLAGPEVAGLGAELEGAATSTEKATAAWEDYQDQLKAALDPMFGYQSALLGVRDAQDANGEATLKYLEAVRLHGEGSYEAAVAGRELERSQLDLGKSAVDVDVAMRQLSQGIQDGTISSGQMTAILAQWVQQGIITKAEADALAWSFGGVASKVESIPNDKRVDLSTSGIPEAISQFHSLAEAIARATIGAHVTVGGVGGVWRGPGLDISGAALGGPLAPRSIYEVHDTPEPEFATIGGRTFMLTGSEGGMMMSGHPGARMPFPTAAPMFPTAGPIYPNVGGYGGAGSSGGVGSTSTVVHAPVTVVLDWPHYLGDRADKDAIVRELAPAISDEVAKSIDALN